MKKFIQFLKKEMLTLFYTKWLLGILLLIAAVMVFNAVSNLNNLKNAYAEYTQTKEYLIRQGEDIDALLQAEANVEENIGSDGAVTTYTDNPLRFTFENVGRSLDAVRPIHITIGFQELLAFMLGPFLFGFMGVWIATYDYKNKTVKIKAIQQEWSNSLWIKQGIVVCLIPLMILLLMACSLAVGAGLFGYAQSLVPDSAVFLSAVETNGGHLLDGFLVSAFVDIIFVEIGFLMGTAFKNATAPLVTLGAYHFFIPNLGKYDLKNLVSVIGHRFFRFSNGTFRLLPPIPIGLAWAFAILTALLMLCCVMSCMISKRQSKYIC